jgi:hypothetical protein
MRSRTASISLEVFKVSRRQECHVCGGQPVREALIQSPNSPEPAGIPERALPVSLHAFHLELVAFFVLGAHFGI